MKKHLYSFLLCLIFLAGMALILYPTISDYLNSFHQSRAIASYADEVAQLDDGRYAQLLADAREYNDRLVERGNSWILSNTEREEYHNQLNISGGGIMAYIEIPEIDCYLPIYHGTDANVLQIAVGHIEGSSLPVGGATSHCVLSGHRGLPSAKLFTNLDQLTAGDLFMIRTLDETLTYEVETSIIVEPNDLKDLVLMEGEDLCTLVTCTPYGINSHRLLVRGRRIENQEIAETIRVTADATQIKPTLVALIVAIPILLVLFLGMMLWIRRKIEIKRLKKAHRFEENEDNGDFDDISF